MPQKIRMSNGNDIPFIGLGTGGKFSTTEEDKAMLRAALDIGYRHIDTAQMYSNEEIIGELLKKEYFDANKLKRQDLFITTKLPPTANRPELVEKSLRSQLRALQLDYVDLFLIHSPCSYIPLNGKTEMDMNGDVNYEMDTTVNLIDTWTAMEQVYKAGLTKAIGLSNFTVEQIQRVYSSASIKPHNLQIEIHLHWQQKELITLCQCLNITVTAYAPIGCPGKKGMQGWPVEGPLDEPLLKQLADKYSRTPAQIALRHLTQRNIIVVPKSTKKERLLENFESSNFFLSDEDLALLNEIPSRKRLYTWAKNRAILDHPEYPFQDSRL